ncbi:MAG: cytochrome c [Paucibacter sp.]|nr:cytochrome c [Roseateles sp.]
MSQAWRVALLLASAAIGPAQAQARYGIGQTVSPAQLRPWDIDVAPDGRNLPRGSGTVAQGKAIYMAQCASCHGEQGQGGLGDKLVGGAGTLATSTPVKTVGSFWPYATTLFDYVRRAMPLNSPQSLSDTEVYAVSGYVLHLNGLLSEGAVVDAKVLTDLKMPNRNGFVGDPRPDVHSASCLRECPTAEAAH